MIRWLHLSDFHFEGLERWDRRATLMALLRHAEELRADGLAPDFVFVTGDIAQSGKRNEYEQAERFFTELAKTLDLEPSAAFFFVPGDHDVDRSLIGAADRSLTGSLTTRDAIEGILADAAAMALLGRRLESFYAFTERILGPARGWRPEHPWRVDVRQCRGVEVAVLQLNSAWTSGSDADRGGLLVGEGQVRSAFEEAADAFLRIILVHHPLADLADVDRAPLENLLTSSNVHFLLRGHLHRTRTGKLAACSLIELATGATCTYKNDPEPPMHLLTEVDLAGGEARVHFFLYSAEGRGFWLKDALSYEDAPDGVRSLPLDAALQLDPEVSEPSILTDARRSTLTARYRTAAAAVHGTIRFVGFADHRPRPNVGVPELFVPLRFEAEGEAHWTTTQLLRHFAGREKPGRVAVLGDPGSGKTTLMRFLTVALAGELTWADVDVDETVLPLFLPFREYVREVREIGDASLIDFLSSSARVQLQISMPSEFLEEALDEGRAVLLLDGLDEVGSAAEREEMRERVQAFCRLYPKVGAVVTSRIAGYEDAPLPRTGTAAFAHLTLAPFDDDDLRQFVTTWFAVQEPADPLARDRGVADLLAALEAGPRVRELARNPMLATLIGLVHRYEAHLPAERAALYDICVKTLLETWPESRRTTLRELDPRLQRAYLEELAYRLQLSRSREGRAVTIGRGPLVDTLVEIIHQREREASPESTRGLVERWVQFLEQGSGLLVEQRPGVFSFFNLSLMEYLAACGMDRAEAVEDLIAEQVNSWTWREVCLLAVGSRATEKAFLDRLFEKLRTEEGGWPFLLRCLREEAAFDDEQRAAIVLGTGRDMLRRPVASWDSDQRTLDEILRFSIRHAAWAAAWLRERLGSERTENLRGLVALRLTDREMLEILAQRGDAPEAAADLLEYWLGTEVGTWAAGTVSAPAAFAWAATSPGELLVLRSLAVEDDILRPATGLLLGLIRTAGAHASLAYDASAALEGRERPGGHGLPEAVDVEPAGGKLVVQPVTSSWIVEARDYDFSRDFPRDFSRDFAFGFSGDFSGDFAFLLSQAFSFDFARYFSFDFARCFSLDFLRDFGRDFGGDSVRYFPLDYARDFAMSLTSMGETSLTEPVTARKAEDRNAIKRHFSAVFARLLGEAWIAIFTTIDRSQEERLAHVRRRVQNAWCLQAWPAIDERFTETSSPEREALYLTLGFTQATTTWQWPVTDRWREILGGEPPLHWLPRSQWHLCWLLHDPSDGVHRRGLDQALEEGLADAERPGVASALQELLPAQAPLARQDPGKGKPPVVSSQAVTILHLSDLQLGDTDRFGGAASGDPVQAILDPLGEDLRTLRDEHDLRPEIIVLTGDLTSRGLGSEFRDVLRLIEGLLELLRLTRDRVVVVPGNHDVNRAASRAYFIQCEADEVEPEPPYWPKWQDYAELFGKLYADQPRVRFTAEQPWSLFAIEDLRVVVAGLNSTIAESHRPEDRNGGFLGDAQLRWFAELLDEYRRKGWLRIAASHHGVEDLGDAETEIHRLAGHLNLLLHGHFHLAETPWLGPSTPAFHSGTYGSSSRIRRRYQFLGVYQDRVRRWSRIYDPDEGFWACDPVSEPDGLKTHMVDFLGVSGTFSEEPLPADAEASSSIPAARELSEDEGAYSKFEDFVPDLVLRIRAENLDGRMELTFVADARDPDLGLSDREFGPLRILRDVRELTLSLFKDIEEFSTRSDESKLIAENRLASKGTYLFRELLPQDLQETLWQLQGHVASIRIESEEPWIPWEIVKLESREGGRQMAGPFLCEAFAVTRWLPGFEEVTSFSLTDIAVISANRELLPGPEEEHEIMMSLADSNRRVRSIPPKFLDVVEALASGQHDVIHYSGHAHVHGDDPSRWAVALDDHYLLTVQDLSGVMMGLGKRHPLIFWNSGHTGRVELSPTGIGGWPKQFIEAGAGAFIGTFWHNDDRSSVAFTAAFYQRLLAGLPIGEAVRQARLEVRQQAPGNPAWLSYTVYANPLARYQPGEQAQVDRPSTEGLRELPEGPFEREGLRLAHRFREAATVSGDFYNVVSREDGGVGIYLVDVTGHGLPATLQAFAIKEALLRAGNDWGTGEAQVQLIRADRAIDEELNDRDAAVTMCFLEIDPGKRKARFANAGMPFPLLFRAGQGQPEVLRAAGVYVGGGYARYPVKPRQAEVELDDGDVIVLYSDGILEASDSRGRQFGQDGIVGCVARAGIGSPEKLADEIIRAVRQHAGRQRPDDDQTLIVVGIGEPIDKRGKVRTLEEAATSAGGLEFSLMNAEDAGDACHEILRPRLKSLASDQGFSDERGGRVWSATWEALQNAVQHGSRRGDVLRIHASQGSAGSVRIEIVQSQIWRESEQFLGRDRLEQIRAQEEIQCGGTVVMLRLASRINVSHQGRKVRMDFDSSKFEK